MSIKKLTVLLTLLAAVFTLSAQRPVHVKWTTSVETISPTEGRIVWNADIEDGWHIYGFTDAPMPTEFALDSVSGVEYIGGIKPSVEPTIHIDETQKMKVPWWKGKVRFTQRFRLTGNTTYALLKGEISYMSCTEEACTPPSHVPFEVPFGVAAPVAEPEPEPEPEPVVAAAPAPDEVDYGDLWEPVKIAPADATSAAVNQSEWWVLLGFGFLGGLLALLTPCVWPMIPMTVSFFLKKGKSRRKAIADAVTYALSIIIIFLVLGIAITMIFGAGKLNEIATSAFFNVLFFLLLVVFAISFFGAFDIKLPSRWSNAMDAKAEKTGGVISIFFMAFTLVLVSFSCTGPIIGTLLVEAASEESILGPALGMGGFALGLALPFGLFAFFPSMLKEMPRSGSWLNTVKVVLGFVELILSLKFLSVADLAYGWRILDREVFLALWIVLFVLLGIYLLGKLRFSHDGEQSHVSVPRFFMATASLSFAVYMLPGLWGAPLKAISAFAPPLTTQDFNLYGGTFKEFSDYDEGMLYAREHNMPVLIDFSGYACVNCRKMEGAVFDTQDVRTILERDYVLIKLMVDDKEALPQPEEVTIYGEPTTIKTVGERWSYLQQHKFGVSTQPYYVILDNHGRPLEAPRSYDENVEAFVSWLNAGVENYKNQEK